MKEIQLTNTGALRREMEKVIVIDEKVNEMKKELAVIMYTKDPIVKNYWENIFPTFPSSFIFRIPIEQHYNYYVEKSQH